MKVLIVCATKFHSDYVALELQNRGHLYRVVTAHPRYSRPLVPVDRKKIVFLPPFYWMLAVLQKYLGRLFFFKSTAIWLQSILYDWMSSLFVGTPDFSISWAWSSRFVMRAAKRKGAVTILEKSGSCNKHQNELMEEEYRRLHLKYESKTDDRIVERELLECKESDYILCPSSYVAATIEKYGINRKKLLIIPYGVDVSAFRNEGKSDGTFRVLFVGTIGVRKGLIYLFRALEAIRLQNFECLLIGRVEKGFEPIFNRFKSYFKYIPRVEHNLLKYQYSKASVFVFPSLDEGMARVQLEAMACGLPVICTPNSGGQDIIDEGDEGYVVPIRDADAIRRKIEQLYHSPQTLNEMSLKAMKRSKQFSWFAYGNKLETALKAISVHKGKDARS